MNHNEEHEILNMDPIPERELADILWNTMQKDGYLNMYGNYILDSLGRINGRIC